MIRAIPPKPTRRQGRLKRPGTRREWMCAYCPAHGPADSEAHQQQLTRAHLEACGVRKRYEARIDRARRAMEATST